MGQEMEMKEKVLFNPFLPTAICSKLPSRLSFLSCPRRKRVSTERKKCHGEVNYEQTKADIKGLSSSSATPSLQFNFKAIYCLLFS